MPRAKARAAKNAILHRVRKQRLRTIAVLPSLVTIINGVAGFVAIVMASKGARDGGSGISYFAVAAYLIFLAMIADMLDGRLARMSKNTSSFGGQLDSLCDIVSFGVAPAFLMLQMLQSKLGAVGFSEGHSVQRLVWLAAGVYLSCAAIRLARFNVENEEDESAHMSFVGLPSPAAAGVVASLVIFHQEAVPGVDLVLYALPLMTFGAGVLMVSRLRYPHVVNQYMRGRKPFGHFMRILLLLGLAAWNHQTVSVVVFCGFASSSLVRWLYYKVLRKRAGLLSDSEAVIEAEPSIETDQQ